MPDRPRPAGSWTCPAGSDAHRPPTDLGKGTYLRGPHEPEHLDSAKPSEKDALYMSIDILPEITWKPTASGHRPHLIHRMTKEPPSETGFNEGSPPPRAMETKLWIEVSHIRYLRHTGWGGSGGRATGWDLQPGSDFYVCETMYSACQRPGNVSECSPLPTRGPCLRR